jgi:catechol 2,3-dioxygenase-like lactoylglutathione lyase family enzyme
MLKDHKTATMIPAKDVSSTRRFYEDVLGFSPENEWPDGSVDYKSGGTQFNVYPTEFAGTAQHTLIGWFVGDMNATVDELTGKGVSFERYDMPELKTDEKGIADFGGVKAAWFKDPEGNILSLWEESK